MLNFGPVVVNLYRNHNGKNCQNRQSFQNKLTKLKNFQIQAGFYPSTFCLQLWFPKDPKIQFLDCLLSSVTPERDPMLDTEGKFLKFRSADWWKFFLDFFWNFKVLWRVLKKSWLERYIQLYFMRVCKCLN